MIDIEWVGDSHNVVCGYSKDVRRAIGMELHLLQIGEEPLHAKPLKTVGPGVWEIKISEKEGQFRVIYIVKRNDRIYVLHTFQKKTQKTPKKDISLAKTRLKEI
jgi:phage-related protein